MKRVFRRLINVPFDSGVLQPDVTYPSTISYVLGLATGNIASIPALTPLTLVPSGKDIVNYLNLFREFKIGKIKLTWVPSVKGKPMRTDNEAGPDESDTYRYGSAAGCEMWIVMPPMALSYYRQASSSVPSNPFRFWYDHDIEPKLSGVDNLPVSNEMLEQMKYPKPSKKNMGNTWSYTWNALTLQTYKSALYMKANEISASTGEPYITAGETGKLERMQWVPLVHPGTETTYDKAHAYDMLSVLHQPVASMKDTKTWEWLTSAQTTKRGIYGKFYLTSTWYFRKRRTNVGRVWTKIGDNAELVYSDAANIGPIIPVTTGP